ncbi:Hypothetical predicted protein [Octopus vulgaris]|uniref:Uncharacterized protein n=1 Tax=Octopus vulgaris TaxID=6645 RepID=A0AA36BIN6_OCTVU|nr:Hypothetical predicted protein [Octopus vulgaris]
MKRTERYCVHSLVRIILADDTTYRSTGIPQYLLTACTCWGGGYNLMCCQRHSHCYSVSENASLSCGWCVGHKRLQFLWFCISDIDMK